MFLSDQSVRRPVFASVISLLLLILGLAAMMKLPVRQYPDVDSPVVSIDTRYRGASAEVVESKITQIIEDRVAGIEGIVVLRVAGLAGDKGVTAQSRRLFDLIGPKSTEDAHAVDDARTIALHELG